MVAVALPSAVPALFVYCLALCSYGYNPGVVLKGYNDNRPSSNIGTIASASRSGQANPATSACLVLTSHMLLPLPKHCLVLTQRMLVRQERGEVAAALTLDALYAQAAAVQ
eukprot:3777475-Rhodomonas_salina.2